MKASGWDLAVMRLVVVGLILAPTYHLAQILPPVPKVIAVAHFEFMGKSYTLELIPKKGAKVQRGGEYCANDGSPELHADGLLILKLESDELSRLNLKACEFVYSQKKWQVVGMSPLRVIKREGALPLIYFCQYETCSGNLYSLYWLEPQNDRFVLKPVKFVKSPQKKQEPHQLYAGHFKEAVRLVRTAQAAPYELWIEGYDNAAVGAFIERYIEDAPGIWRYIGEYTYANGLYEKMKKRFR